MAYVLFALFLFGFSVAVHVFFCRRAKGPGLQAKAYIFITVFFIAIYIAGVYLAGQNNLLDPHSFWGLPFKITSVIILVLMVPIYLCFYTLTQLMSPSKKILLCLRRHGSLSYAQVLKYIEEEDFINTRLTDLISSGCVRQEEGRYSLCGPGKNIAMVLNYMQLILGRDMGG